MTCVSVRLRGASALVGALAILSVCGATARTAAAQTYDIRINALDPPAPSDKAKNPSPSFEASIKGAVPGLSADQFELKQLIDFSNPPTADFDKKLFLPSIRATKVKTYKESSDKMALVILIEGNGRWMGNETYAEEDNEVPEAGAFTGLGAAIDQFAGAGPPGSLGAVLLFGDGQAAAKQPMGDASKLSGSVLGKQKDYENNLDVPLLVGLKEAIATLDRHTGYRKILVVIGDGTGERDDITADLNARVDELKQRKFEVYSIFYEALASGNPAGQGNMKKLGLSGSFNADSKDSIATYAKAIVDEIGARYYVDFPGCDTNTPQRCFVHNGQIHEFAVVVQGTESDPIEVLTKTWLPPQPPKERSLWWLWLILVLLGVGLILFLVVRWLQSREVVVEPEVPLPAPAPAAAPAAAKTMMIGIGGSDDSIPMVGWIVPLSGPNQYQTFKLLQGITKIGSGGSANIVIQDGFMSSEHAEFVISPIGFILKDGGSTNGTYVNNIRIAQHELVDNDIIMMGQTSFRYKSIN